MRHRRIVPLRHDRRRRTLGRWLAVRAIGERDAEDLRARGVHRLDQQRLAVGREDVAVRVAVPLREQLARLLRRALVEHDTPMVRLESGARLRAVHDEAAVGRIDGVLIGALVRGGDHGRRSARRRHDVHVHVGAPRIGASLILRGVRDLLAIGREGIAVARAVRAGRHIVRRVRREIDRRRAIGADHEQVLPRAGVPCVPVAVHERVGDVRLHERSRRACARSPRCTHRCRTRA